MCILFSRFRIWFRLKFLSRKIRVNDLVSSVETQKFLDSHPRRFDDFSNYFQSV